MFDVEQDYGLLQTLDDHSAAIQAVRFTDQNNKLRMLSCGSDKSLLFRNASLVSTLLVSSSLPSIYKSLLFRNASLVSTLLVSSLPSVCKYH